jgi:acyl-CoA oxidase
MGEKLGLNGVDNGFMMFDRYRVTREALLDATGGIDQLGNYVTPYKDPSKRFGASLGKIKCKFTCTREIILWCGLHFC